MIMILYKDHHQHASSPLLLLLLLFLILMIMIMIIMIIMIIITIIIIIMNMIISPNITFRNNVQACNTDSVVWFACDNPGLRMAHRKGSESRPHRPARGTQASRSGNLWNFPVGNVQKIRFYGDNDIKETTGFWATPLAGVWVRQCENGMNYQKNHDIQWPCHNPQSVVRKGPSIWDPS